MGSTTTTNANITESVYNINDYQVKIDETHIQNQPSTYAAHIFKNGTEITDSSAQTNAWNELGLSGSPTGNVHWNYVSSFLKFAENLATYEKDFADTNNNHIGVLRAEDSLTNSLKSYIALDAQSEKFNIEPEWITSAQIFIGKVHQFGVEHANEYLTRAQNEFNNNNGVLSQDAELVRLVLTHADHLTSEQKNSAQMLETKIAQATLRNIISININQLSNPTASRDKTTINAALTNLDELNEKAKFSEADLLRMETGMLHTVLNNLQHQLKEHQNIFNGESAFDRHRNIENTKKAIANIEAILDGSDNK